MANVFILALLAYAGFAVTDVAVKAAAGRLPIFETALIVNVFAAAVLLTTRHPNERWRDFFRPGRHTLAVHVRAFCGTVSSLGAVYALTRIPLAQVYAIVFLAPIFVTAMSALFLKERVSPARWVAVAVGFVGVLLVVQPGYQPLESGHLAAVCVGMATGGAIVLLRGMGQGVRKTRVLGTLMAYLLVLDVVATIVWGFVLPTWWEFGMLGLAGIAFGLGQWAFVLAARAGHANQIAPMQYSQLVWAVGLGALFFGEYVDPVASVGIAVLIASGLATIFVVAPAGAKIAATADRNNSAETGGIRS